MPTFFTDATALRLWLGKLVVGFHTTQSGLPSISWPQAVDEALIEASAAGLRI
jgi:hypothetical protein